MASGPSSEGARLCRILLCCFFGVVSGLQPVSVGQLRVVGSDFVVSLPVMLSRPFVAVGRLPAALGCLQVMFVDLQGFLTPSTRKKQSSASQTCPPDNPCAGRQRRKSQLSNVSTKLITKQVASGK